MNTFFCSLLASSLLLAGLGSKAVTDDPDYNYAGKIDYVSIEPSKGPRAYARMVIKCSLKSVPTRRVLLNITIKNSNYFSRLINSFALTSKSATRTFNYPETYSDLSSEDTFIITLNGQNISDDVTIPTKKYDPRTMYVRNLNEIVESPENITIYRYKQGVSYHSEKFIFSNMIKEVDIERYRGVDLSKLYFSYVAPEGFPLTYENPRLIIESNEGALENIGQPMATPNHRKCEIEMSKVENTNQYHIHLVDQLYVHPITLDMSMTPQEGYIATNYLFFPAAKGGVDTYVVRFMIDDVGANDYDFSYEITINVSSNPLGSCTESSFCLSSEDATPDLELGTIINY